LKWAKRSKKKRGKNISKLWGRELSARARDGREEFEGNSVFSHEGGGGTGRSKKVPGEIRTVSRQKRRNFKKELGGGGGKREQARR